MVVFIILSLLIVTTITTMSIFKGYTSIRIALIADFSITLLIGFYFSILKTIFFFVIIPKIITYSIMSIYILGLVASINGR